MIAAQLLFTHAPIMNRLFHTAPIEGQAWLRIMAVAVAAYAIVGLEKWVRCRWGKAGEGKGRLFNPKISEAGRFS